MGEYVCDDRDQLDVIHEVNSMSDEEFERYIQRLKETLESNDYKHPE